jgi:hypothetical protein
MLLFQYFSGAKVVKIFDMCKKKRPEGRFF